MNVQQLHRMVIAFIFLFALSRVYEKRMNMQRLYLHGYITKV